MIDGVAQRCSITCALALQRQRGAAVALHARPIGRCRLARIHTGRQPVAVQRRVQPGRIAVAFAQHDLRCPEQCNGARPVLRRCIGAVDLQCVIAGCHRRVQHHRVVDACAKCPQCCGQAALRLRPVERRIASRRQFQRRVEGRDRVCDARDVLVGLAFRQQDLGLGDRLPPRLAGSRSAHHFSARISAKVSLATSRDSRINGTPT